MQDTFHIVSKLEETTEYHLGRLLILLYQFSGSSGKDEIQGITKLAKLDFLLRYPVYLEKALKVKGHSTSQVKTEYFERTSIESGMVRYKYGPWDHRYYQFINCLVGKGLAYIRIDGRTKNIGITNEGGQLVKILFDHEEFQLIVHRASILKRYFDNRATYLMKFIYRTFPELSSMKLGQEIKYED